MRRCGGWRSRSPDEGSCYATQPRGLDVPEATFTGPDLMTLLGLEVLGLTAVGQFVMSLDLGDGSVSGHW